MLKYGIRFYNEDVKHIELTESVEKFLSNREKDTLGKTEISIFIGPDGFVSITFKTYPKKDLALSEAKRRAAEAIIEFSKYLPPTNSDVEVFVKDENGLRSLSFPLEANR